MIAAGDFKDPFPLGGKNNVISNEGFIIISVNRLRVK